MIQVSQLSTLNGEWARDYGVKSLARQFKRHEERVQLQAKASGIPLVKLCPEKIGMKNKRIGYITRLCTWLDKELLTILPSFME
jgi:hypothetical protein